MADHGRHDEFLRPSDAFSWYQEADPAMRTTIVGIAWLDHCPDWETLRTKVDGLTRTVRRFRQRVVEAPWHLFPPRWVLDEEFDLAWHLRRVSAPAPRTPATVLELARVEAMAAFDRARPLWTFTLVDGLEDGRAAFVMKVHHSLTDGQGAIKLAPLLFDRHRATMAAPLPPEPAPDPGPSPLVAGLTYQAGRVASQVVDAALGVLPAGAALLRDPLGSAREVAATVGAIGTTVAPVTDVLSPVMTGRGLGRTLDMLTVDLADLKDAAHRAKASVNDAFLASVAAGLRRYHQWHGTHPDELRVMMPISIRNDNDPAASNRITLMRFPVPVGESDPVRLMTEIDARCRTMRESRSLPFTDAIAGGLNLLPRAAVGSIVKRVDFLASDVTGLPTRVFLAGAELTAYVAFGPTLGCAVNLTLMSYHGACHVGITLDSAAVPDADVFAECLREGFRDVLTPASRRAHVRRPVHDGDPAVAGSA